MLAGSDGFLAVEIVHAFFHRVAGKANVAGNLDQFSVAFAFFIILDHALVEAELFSRLLLAQFEGLAPAAKLLGRHIEGF